MNLINIMKALADETRLRILALLENRELNVNELVKILDMGQSRVSRHLKIMTASGLLRGRRDGLWIFYSLAPETTNKPLLKELRQCLRDLPAHPQDRQKRENVIKQRSHHTTQLFNNLAGNWKGIKAEIYGSLDLDNEIAGFLPEGDSLVDIGCGNGDLLQLLRKKSHLLIGVDNSPMMLEKAAETLHQVIDRVDLRLGNIEHLPLGDKEVENAVINMVLHHSDSPPSILSEACRVLKPGGHLVLADFTKHNREIMRTNYGDRHLGFDPRELAGYLKDSGFNIEKEKHIPLEGELEIILFVTIKEE